MRTTTPRICQVLHWLRVGGAEVLGARIARQLSDRYRFFFACLDDLGPLGEQLRAEGFPVEVLERRPGLDWRCPLKLSRLWKSWQIDIVHAHQYTPFFYSMAARLLHRRPPVLFTEHGRFHPDYPRRKRMIANRLLLERRDRVVGVGEAVRQALIHNEGFPHGRVGIVYNGIDLDAFAAPVDRTAVRREMGVAADDLVVLQVARLDHLKDHATAIRTIEHVGRQQSNARLVLVGDGPERAKIEQLVAERRLADHVRLLGQRTAVARFYPAADVFLLTSISEGIPLTLIEAMAASLPVVSTNVGGVPEVVTDGVTGLLAPAGNDAALAQHVLQLAGDAELRRRLGAAGRERAEATFSERQMLAAYDRLYQEMLHV